MKNYCNLRVNDAYFGLWFLFWKKGLSSDSCQKCPKDSKPLRIMLLIKKMSVMQHCGTFTNSTASPFPSRNMLAGPLPLKAEKNLDALKNRRQKIEKNV